MEAVLYRTLEAIFRRPWRLLMLIVLPPLMAIALVYVIVPRTYQSTAVLWALSPFELAPTTNTGVGQQPVTAAQTQAAALSELLQTRSFSLTIAHETGVAVTLDLDQSVRSNPRLLDDALFNEISNNVVVSVLGNDVLGISYANRDPKMAQRVVQTVISNYGLQITSLVGSVNQSLLMNYQRQLATAQKNADAAVEAEAAYLQAHPSLTQNPNVTPSQLLTDPGYALLDQQRVQAQTILENIENNIATLNQTISNQGTSSDSFYKVIDYPQIADRSVSRLKLYLASGVIGLVVALLAGALYVIVLLRHDRGVYTLRDVQKVTALPLVMLVPYLSTRVQEELTTFRP